MWSVGTVSNDILGRCSVINTIPLLLGDSNDQIWKMQSRHFTFTHIISDIFCFTEGACSLQSTPVTTKSPTRYSKSRSQKRDSY
jgi:hypothetical protein